MTTTLPREHHHAAEKRGRLLELIGEATGLLLDISRDMADRPLSRHSNVMFDALSGAESFLSGAARLVETVDRIDRDAFENRAAARLVTDVAIARDAGDLCHVCGEVVTWAFHLPPRRAGGPVLCRVAERDAAAARGEIRVAAFAGGEQKARELDMDESPFQMHEIEGLPLTKEQRAWYRTAFRCDPDETLGQN